MAALAVGLGLLVIVAPWSLDRFAEQRARRALVDLLARRLGGDVTVGAVRARGPFGVVLRGVRVSWPGPGVASLELAQVRAIVDWQAALSMRLRVRELRVAGGRLLWRRPGALSELRRLVRRVARTRSRADGRGGSGEPVSMARLSIRLDRVDVLETGRGRAPYGLRRIGLASLDLTREADGRSRVLLGSVRVGVGQGGAALLRNLRWEGLPRRSGGLRTRRLRVAEAEVRLDGVSGAKERFSLRADEVAPDLLELHLVSPPGRPKSARGRELRTRGLSIYSLLDGQKRRARVEAGGLLALRHLGRFTRGLGVDLSLASLRGLARASIREGEASVTADVSLNRVRIRRRLLAPRAIRWPRLQLKVKGRYLARTSRFLLERASLTVAGVQTGLSGELTMDDGSFRLRLEATLPTTSCARLFDALPEELIPKLRGMRLGGSLGARLHMSLDSRAIEDLELGLKLGGPGCVVLRDPPAARVAALKRPFTFVTRPPGWRPTRLVMGPSNPNWRSYSRLGRNVKAAFLAAEDRRFFSHHGFDLENIRRALATNLRQGSLLKGASSISQQVVKNVFLSHRRDVSRKLQEAILTWRLEQVISKRRILEIYLNLVEMGPGIFGVRAAARHYFQREPGHLGPLEAAHLAAVTPSPRRYFRRFRSGRAGMDWLLHLRWLLYQMLRTGWIDRKSFEESRTQDLRLISYR